MEIVRQYTNRLDNFLSSVNAEVIEPDQISHRKLVIKDLARQKPFSPKGRGYRDALIWETVLDTVHRHGEDVIFVTDNNSDFPTEEDGTLHKGKGSSKGKGSGLELSDQVELESSSILCYDNSTQRR